MALSQTPNPARISSWSATRSSVVTIHWDTESGAKGQVVWYMNDDELNEQKLGSAAKSGDANLTVALGNAYVLRLLDDSTGAQIGAVLNIDMEEFVPLPANMARSLRARIPSTQRIYDVRVTPGVETVDIRFRTSQPCQPWLDVRTASDHQSVGGATGPYQTNHHFRFGQQSSLWGPLQQETKHIYQIIVGVAYKPNLAVRGSFLTGTREATAVFDGVTVYDDSDNGVFDGAGDFNFQVGLGGIKGPGHAE